MKNELPPYWDDTILNCFKNLDTEYLQDDSGLLRRAHNLNIGHSENDYSRIAERIIGKMAKVRTYTLSAVVALVTLMAAQSYGFNLEPDPDTPDTLWVTTQTANLSGQVAVPVYFYNDEALAGIEITLFWDSQDISLDSFSFEDGRIDYVSIKDFFITGDTLVAYCFPFNQADIAPGTGLLGRMYFSYSPTIAPQIITFDTITIVEDMKVHGNFFSDVVANRFVPQYKPGHLIFQDPSCCIGDRGNFNGSPSEFVDISDLTALIDYMFGGGPVAECRFEGNINGDPDEVIDISDLTYLVEYIFGGGPHPAPCP